MESAYYVDTGLLSPDATGIQIMSIFGSSTLTSSSSSRSGAAAKASAAAAAAAAPPFPTFLLPALPLQLFRRRQNHQQQQSSFVAHRNNTTAGDGELVNIKIGRSENRQLVTGSHVVADISCRVCGTKVGWKYVDARESQQKYKVGKFILETARVVAWRGWEAGRLPTAAEDSDDDDDYDNDDDGEYAWSSADECGAQSSRPSTASGQKGEAEAEADDGEGPIVFDSDDDDECEDIFAGTWNAETVAKRRKMRRALVGRRV
ncbi:hypothetical protein MAPG_06231 [Magnaporthiopsis poae ATCC 64411]|uniref:Yippee domain-containing protein n=1 Tax=Magnaporthiopsis poae (strain ATCC 64411 / 73-15) TaxID=644358 RepID=A0A0C4E1H0_MAGP6|nr:hypothetical protein MAPG_06231 [Magnaporthiopsis poae ATCC 64411]